MATPPRAPTIGFLLPRGIAEPVGGVKVVLEYANALVARGWHVKVAMPHLLEESSILRARSSPWRRLRRALSFANRRLRGDHRPRRWFRVDARVEMLFLPTPERLPAADAWVATAWQTARWVARTGGAKLYLIQHLETCFGPEAEVVATWKLPLRKIVIAGWLADFAGSLGERADLIPNGLDFEAFGIDLNPSARSSSKVLMLYHSDQWKGSADGLSALEAARRKHPGLATTLFGVPKRPAGLPEWIAYERQPSQRRLRALYNEAGIFVAPSRVEGFGLTPAEAMACGCAVVATDVGGHRTFAFDGDTALLAPPKDPASLGQQLVRLVEDPALRIKIAQAGAAFIRRFTWERASNAFEAVLRDELAAHQKCPSE